MCSIFCYTFDSVYHDIFPPFNYYKLAPHIYFSLLCAHFEALSPCDEESLIHEDSMNEVNVEEDIMVHDVFYSISYTLGEFIDGVSSLFIQSHIIDVVDLHEEITFLFYISPHSGPFEDIIMVSLPYFDEPPSPHFTIATLEPSLSPFILQQNFCDTSFEFPSPPSLVGISLGDLEGYIEVSLSSSIATFIDISFMKHIESFDSSHGDPLVLVSSPSLSSLFVKSSL